MIKTILTKFLSFDQCSHFSIAKIHRRSFPTRIRQVIELYVLLINNSPYPGTERSLMNSLYQKTFLEQTFPVHSGVYMSIFWKISVYNYYILVPNVWNQDILNFKVNGQIIHFHENRREHPWVCILVISIAILVFSKPQNPKDVIVEQFNFILWNTCGAFSKKRASYWTKIFFLSYRCLSASEVKWHQKKWVAKKWASLFGGLEDVGLINNVFSTHNESMHRNLIIIFL